MSNKPTSIEEVIQKWEAIFNLYEGNQSEKVIALRGVLNELLSDLQSVQEGENTVIKSVFGILSDVEELNMANYTYEQVSNLNQAVIDSYLLLDKFINPPTK
jgi:hypothetical protein